MTTKICKSCNKPISKHKAGRETDNCILKLFTPNGKQKLLMEFFTPDYYFHRFNNKYVIRRKINKVHTSEKLMDLRGLILELEVICFADTPLAICHAALVKASKERDGKIQA